MEKKKYNLNNGITLVALVITIIVLLILAGVAINLAMDSNGLFAKANEAVTKWNSAIAEEDRIMQNILEQMNEINGETTGGGTIGGEEPTNPEEPTEPEGPTLPSGWDATKVSDIVTEGTRKAPIPVGYVASQIPTEDTISEGLVIYQGTDPVTGEVNSTAHTTAMTTRNQFVWIPVDDINYMIMCKSNSSTSVCNIALQTDGTLKCEKHNSTDLCGRVYATTSSNTTVDSKKIYTYSQTFNEAELTKQTWSTSSYREPDIVSGKDTDDTASTTYMATAGITSGKVADFQAQLTSDFTAMATSVAKYGGFYVSRYEAGANGASLKNQKVLVAGTSTATGYDSNTFIDGNMWYGMYNTLRTSSVIDKTAINSHMIWGSQYDMIIKYLGENNLNEPQVGHTARQLATQELTGETTKDIMSNIYDLEGNNREWTAQAYDTIRRVIRGGKFGFLANYSSVDPASYRSYYYSYGTDCYDASRSVLYVK